MKTRRPGVNPWALVLEPRRDGDAIRRGSLSSLVETVGSGRTPRELGRPAVVPRRCAADLRCSSRRTPGLFKARKDTPADVAIKQPRPGCDPLGEGPLQRAVGQGVSSPPRTSSQLTPWGCAPDAAHASLRGQWAGGGRLAANPLAAQTPPCFMVYHLQGFYRRRIGKSRQIPESGLSEGCGPTITGVPDGRRDSGVAGGGSQPPPVFSFTPPPSVT